MLFISDSTSTGGAPRVLFDIVRYVNRNRFEPFVLLGRSGPLAGQLSQVAPTFIYPYPLSIPKTGGLQKHFKPLGARLFFRWVTRRAEPDVIYHNTVGGDVWRNAARRLSVPRILHLHGIHVEHMARGNRKLSQLADFADHYVCCAKVVEDIAGGCLPIPPERLSTIYTGVDVDGILSAASGDPNLRQQIRSTRFGADDSTLLIGGAGGFFFIKGVDLLVRTAAIIRQRYPKRPIKFVWLGGNPASSNPYVQAVTRLASRSGLGDYFLFPGHQEDIYNALSALDIFVMSSRQEALPLVALEAMCLRKPVVSFPVGGMPEVLSAGNGVLVLGFSPDSLADAICTLLEDPARRAALGDAGYHHVRENFNIRQNLPAIENLIERVLLK